MPELVSFTLRTFTPGDYAAAVALWQQTEGMGMSESDSECAITRYLRRNPDLSLVATDANGALIGTVLAGHDGRRGHLYHLAVAQKHRKNGLGRALVDEAIRRLSASGITRTNIQLFATNLTGRSFWLHEGWRLRDDLIGMQKIHTPSDERGC